MTTEVNLGFQAELEAQQNEGKVDTLKAPQSTIETQQADTSIQTEELFGKDAMAGKIPELTQEFVIQKSKQDKLIELGQVAQEMYETQKVSRSQVIAIESIARELIPATEEEVASSERKVVVSDHEVNMYTEEPSSTEAANTITNCQANVDRIVSDIRNSAIALGTQLVKTSKNDSAQRTERILKGVSLFNQAICKFLVETDSASLENSNIRFKRDLAWGSLMSIPVDALFFTGESLEQYISTFDGTSAETFIKNLRELLKSNQFVYPLLSNFVAGKQSIVRGDDYASKKESMVKPFTFGDLFSAFGSAKFTAFYNYLNEEASTQTQAAKAATDLLQGETSIDKIVVLSNELQNQQKCLMDINANLSVLCSIQYAIIEFLSTF